MCGSSLCRDMGFVESRGEMFEVETTAAMPKVLEVHVICSVKRSKRPDSRGSSPECPSASDRRFRTFHLAWWQHKFNNTISALHPPPETLLGDKRSVEAWQPAVRQKVLGASDEYLADTRCLPTLTGFSAHQAWRLSFFKLAWPFWSPWLGSDLPAPRRGCCFGP
ncbi:hypothetical protein OPT61_g5471 [Boeremia exigua]|uniref:Uncharacterized protein n=1 Tax=Boeremia exigua TaxID=749465 RepID=A0ACC2IAE5_9PLEO|nr:hypothetical protein OPT61_g5471 [Boeremia exigua]